MITHNDRKKWKHIPYRNSKLIQSILEEKGKTVYTQKYISNVFRGIYNNLDIAEAYAILNERIAAQKRNIKKPEAVTPGS